jgi:hypothetical protein
VTARTSRGNYDVSVELGWQPADVTALMTSCAIGRSRDVISRLASRRSSVVASRAVGGRRENAVIYLGPCPDRGGLVARLAIRRRHQVAA